jgi:uncharacterized protein
MGESKQNLFYKRVIDVTSLINLKSHISGMFICSQTPAALFDFPRAASAVRPKKRSESEITKMSCFRLGREGTVRMQDEVLKEVSTVFLLLLCCIVDAPDAVKMDTVPDGVAIVFRVSVARGDLGKVIGLQGRNARALRILLNAAGVKQGRKFVLDIVGKFDDLS